MTVYVDNIKIPWRGMLMSHMTADTIDELHEFADKLGLKRIWAQLPPEISIAHYDVSEGMRQKAIRLGAIEEDWRSSEAVERHREQRRRDRAVAPAKKKRPPKRRPKRVAAEATEPTVDMSFSGRFQRTADLTEQLRKRLGDDLSDEDTVELARSVIDVIGGFGLGIWLELHRLANAAELGATAQSYGALGTSDKKLANAIEIVADRLVKEYEDA